MFKPERLVKVTCIFPKKFLWNVISKLQDTGMVHLIKAKLAKGFKLMKITGYEYKKMSGLLSRIDILTGLIESRTLKSFSRKFFGPKYIYALPPKGFTTKKISKALKNLEKKYSVLRYKKIRINASDYNQLLLFRDVVADMLERYKISEFFIQSKYTMSFEGWIEPDKLGRVTSAIESATRKACVINVNIPRQGEDVPTLIKNPLPIKPFEIFTENYGVPGYREIDPTPITAITFTLIFGFMFADIGYGLSLFVLSVIVYLYTTKESKFRRNLNIVLIYLGFVSMIFGFFFGEFFGVHLRKGVIDPLSDILFFLAISIIVGLLHISIGILVKMAINLNKFKYLLQGLSLLLFIWAGFSLFYTQATLNKSLFIISVALLAIVGKFEALKDILSLFAGALSYVRIAALGLGHIIVSRLLASSYSVMSSNIFNILLFIGMFLTGSFIILTLGVLVTVLQDLRLHWVEFLPKFFVGKGIKFKPFKHIHTL